jgi:hypothetical protein
LEQNSVNLPTIAKQPKKWALLGRVGGQGTDNPPSNTPTNAEGNHQLGVLGGLEMGLGAHTGENDSTTW